MLCFAVLLLLVTAAQCKPTTPRPSLSRTDFQKRPLNLYITANAWHAKSAKRSVVVGDERVEYLEALPPFSIRTRGSILVVAQDPSLLTAARPSLLGMMSSSGHRTIIVQEGTDVAAFIRAAEMHKVTLIAFAPVAMDNTLEGLLSSVVIVDAAEDAALPSEKIPLLLLYTRGAEAESEGLGEGTRVESIPYSIPDIGEDEAARLAVAQVLVNFLDYVNPR